MQARRLLIVDDDVGICEVIDAIATGVGFLSRIVIDAGKVIEVVEEWQPTHIVLDLRMPGIDGMELLVRLARRGCTAEIIIESGAGERVLAAASRSASDHGLNIAGVLAKPFLADALLALLHEPLAVHPSKRAVGKLANTHDKYMLADIVNGLDAREFVAWFQPKIECKSGELCGFEALVRWNHPRDGVVAPDNFLPLVERLGLMVELTRQVLEQSVSFLARTFGQGSKVSVSVNISPKVLQRVEFIEDIFTHDGEQAIDPHRIIFELTETNAMEDPVVSLAMLTRLRVHGYRLSIDDFGTGFSSMVQLVKLPFSEIKIDKSFVMDAMSSQESRSVVKSVIDLGHSLGLEVTAEGVEDQAALDLLNEFGCDLAQGYYISRPMPEAAVVEWLERRGTAMIL